MPDRYAVARAELGRIAAEELIAGGVELTPPRYEVWHLHRAGAAPEISDEIDQWLAMHDAVNGELLDRLHRQYCENIVSIRKIAAIVRRFQISGRAAIEISRDFASAVKLWKLEAETVAGAAGGDDAAPLGRALMDRADQLAVHAGETGKRLIRVIGELDDLYDAPGAVEKEAFIDKLTGLSSRRHFEDSLQQLCDTAAAKRQSLAAILVQIENLTTFNEVWGRAVGDDVIKYVAAVVARRAPEPNLIARYGGGELIVMLPERAPEEAVEIASELAKTVCAKRLKRKQSGDEIGRIRIACGVASYEPGVGVGDFILAALDALDAARETTPMVAFRAPSPPADRLAG